MHRRQCAGTACDHLHSTKVWILMRSWVSPLACWWWAEVVYMDVLTWPCLSCCNLKDLTMKRQYMYALRSASSALKRASSVAGARCERAPCLTAISSARRSLLATDCVHLSLCPSRRLVPMLCIGKKANWLQAEVEPLSPLPTCSVAGAGQLSKIFHGKNGRCQLVRL